MEFDINDAKHKPFITKELILKHYTDYEIFRFYCGEFELHKAFSSPLREDKNPSFSLYLKDNNEIYFNDFTIGKGDFVTFIMTKHPNFNYNDALSKIGIDLGLDKYYKCSTIPSYYKIDKPVQKINFDKSKVEKSSIRIKRRDWLLRDKAFWTKFGINKPTLIKHNVVPIEYAFFGSKIVKVDRLTYAFIEHKDGQESYTIYQPNKKEEKWFKNHDSSVWYGWEQLPTQGEILIITKSKKDVMAIDENLGLPSTGLQNEKIHPKNHIMQDLKKRFKTILVLYDNDYDKETNWGREFGEELCENFNLIQIEIPEKYKSKDFSDLIKNHGKETACKVVKELINNIIHF